jgi:ABC-2 type transport system permease protein
MFWFNLYWVFAAAALIDIGVFAKEKKNGNTEQQLLYLEKHRITTNEVNLEIVVDAKPTHAGIDPYNKLADRKSDDNEIEVKEQEKM